MSTYVRMIKNDALIKTDGCITYHIFPALIPNELGYAGYFIFDPIQTGDIVICPTYKAYKQWLNDFAIDYDLGINPDYKFNIYITLVFKDGKVTSHSVLYN